MRSLNWGRGLGLNLLAWCAGVAVQLQQAALWPMPSYAALLGAALLLAAGLRWAGGAKWAGQAGQRVGPSLALAWCLTAATAGFALTGLHAGTRMASIDPALEGQDLELVGLVQAMPQRQALGLRFRFRIEQAWRVDAAQSVPVVAGLPEQVYLGWYARSEARPEAVNEAGMDNEAFADSADPVAILAPVKAGERWRMRVRLKAPHGHLNPRGFDYELWMWEQGIRATGYVRNGAKDPAPQRLAITWARPIEAWRQSVRERILMRLSPSGGLVPAQQPTGQAPQAGDPGAGIVAALVTGDQAAIERSDWDVFRATGVAHLMSISGLHVTMFAWLASILVAWGWRHSALWGLSWALHWPAPQVGALSGLLLAGFYALFSGWGVPAQRTLCMLAVVVLLKISARQWPGPLVWLLAGSGVLALDPWALLQPGFWLSFVAVGILMATGRSPLASDSAPAQNADLVSSDDLHPKGALQRMVSGHGLLPRAWGLLREQAIVTLALAPLTLLFFGQVSLVGLVANLLAIPWVTLVVTPLSMLGVLWSDVWLLAAWALQPMTAVLNAMAAWPLASVSSAMPPWGLALLALAGAAAWVLPLPWAWKLLCLPLVWPAVFWSPPRPVPGVFELLAADVGQGNAVLVRTAQHSLLYDTGPRYSSESDAGQRVLVPLLAQMGERIDVLMLSHRDRDHTGGAAAVLAMQKQAKLWTSLEDEHPLHALRPAWTRCQRGQSWLWDGVLFELLHPPVQGQADTNASVNANGNAIKPIKPIKPNTLSCVLRISTPGHGGAAALLAGDIEAPQEQALLSAGLAPVHLLLVPHHGSKTSSTPAFLQALQPQQAWVQAGYRNRYGHPAPEVVQRYQQQGIALVASTPCGAMHWRSDAPAQTQCQRHTARRYWHHSIAP